ncbi:MAG: hypothetical protein CM1200mP29_04480 [Verrucomicrobiota bacterium]|nr:MAG: hypothetical protein CM1200mP29_04480 [Verrucomicrobiota bacterium]
MLTQHGSVYWNDYRQRWVMVISQSFGSSMLGEIWFAEAARPEGPWAYARKIVTHDDYSFYNPKQHPYFAKDGGRTLFFEATYTSTFSGNKYPTPLYDYNQVMYRIQLNDPRLNLPVPVYERPDVPGRQKGTEMLSPGFSPYPIRPTVWSRSVWRKKPDDSCAWSRAQMPFSTLPLTRCTRPKLSPTLHEWTRVDQGQTIYDYDTKPPANGNWERSSTPLGHVWPLRRSISP